MGKIDAVVAFDSALVEAKGALYDAGFADGVASVPVVVGGGFTQENIDAAVAAQKAIDDQALADALAADQAVDEAKLAELQAQCDVDKAALQVKIDELVAKQANDEATVKGLQDAMSAVQASWDAVKALFQK